ncbi:MAG: hypothetical protein KatS3mg105_4688 [Gemmatales bacterium]|nr:MAG: hypothetical protein KatS3mg105_4688 [Gemmatales bacterium]
MAVPSGRYRFTGREFESITGFQYHRARYYDPATGRWTSQDPLGLLADINPYRYAGNSPTNFIDPDGQLFLPIPLLFGAAVLAVLLQPQIANAPSQTDVPTGRNDFGLALLGSVEATALLTPASIGLRGTTAAVASAPTRRWALLALSERVIGGGAGAVEGVLQAQAGGGSAADQLIAGVLGFGFGLISPRAAFSSFATASAAGAVGGIIGGRPGARVGFQVGGLIGAFGHTLTSAAVAARGQGATRALLTGLRGVAPEAASAGLGAVVFPELLGVDPLTGRVHRRNGIGWRSRRDTSRNRWLASCPTSFTPHAESDRAGCPRRSYHNAPWQPVLYQ